MVLDRIDQLEASVAQLLRDMEEVLEATGITEKRDAERKEAEDAAKPPVEEKPEDGEPLGHDPKTWSPTDEHAQGEANPVPMHDDPSSIPAYGDPNVPPPPPASPSPAGASPASGA